MLKYFIPIYGLLCIWKDIPHYEYERSYKPLQGDLALMVMVVSWLSSLLLLLIIILILCK